MNKLPRLLIALGALVAGALVGVAHAQDAKPAQAGAQGGSAAAGEKKAAMCIGCHGIPAYQASFPEIYKVPMIAGQNAKYIVSALTAYKKGERNHPTMHAQAMSFSDQDIADIAAYLSSLKPAK